MTALFISVTGGFGQCSKAGRGEEERQNGIVYVEKSYEIYKKLLEIIREFSKVAEYKINIQESIVYLYTSNTWKLKL